MLKRLYLQNFTVFADAEFEFGTGLSALVGEDGLAHPYASLNRRIS